MFSGDELASFLRNRAGKLTASRMKDAIAFNKKGEPLEARSKLMRELLAERLTGDSVRHYVTDAMRFGIEQEDEAKLAFEAHTGEFVAPSVTYDHPRIEWFAGSPDGELPRGRLLEVKVPTSATYIGWRLAGVVPEEHKPQMIAQCAVTGRRRVVFCAFDPRQKNPAHQLFVRDFIPTDEEIAAIETAAETFLAELDAMFELFTTSAA